MFSGIVQSLALAINKWHYFPGFILSSCSLVTVNQFKYVGHIIDNSNSDNSDINREINASNYVH